MRQTLSRAVYEKIQSRVRDGMRRAGVDALIVEGDFDVAYLTGFFHSANERPCAVYMTLDETYMLVPALEADNAARQKALATFVVYDEFPGVEDAFSILLRRLAPRGTCAYSPETPAGRVAKFKSYAPAAEWIMADIVGDARLIKLPEEIALHREAARISDLMVLSGIELIREALAKGSPLPSESELATHVKAVGVRTMFAEHADIVIGKSMSGGLVYTGENSSYPHGLPSGQRLAHGDTFILSLGCAVGGRFAESERTFVLGEPSAQQRDYYDVAMRSQQIGSDALTVGTPCEAANRICLDVIRDAGMGKFIRHRQGHGIGVWLHEAPWISDGDSTPLAAGMVVSSEPGIYVPGHAGYRISDTILITDAGPERLTTYPRDLASCTIL
ncbi:M24 family metallopeptidase [Ketogulonicigenium vulgare]|uniref:M24 family metallopeptidase n=1 Tax=Ketogulonicigenium vulgare TaxID=92945 RepID=UPI0023598383|nr:Xaa-Pro peptidase family protein [Ketogulonicigenium vulgare]